MGPLSLKVFRLDTLVTKSRFVHLVINCVCHFGHTPCLYVSLQLRPINKRCASPQAVACVYLRMKKALCSVSRSRLYSKDHGLPGSPEIAPSRMQVGAHIAIQIQGHPCRSETRAETIIAPSPHSSLRNTSSRFMTVQKRVHFCISVPPSGRLDLD